MNRFDDCVSWARELSTWQKWALGCGAVAAVAVTGGVALAAIAEGGIVVVVGDIIVAAGPVAVALVAAV